MLPNGKLIEYNNNIYQTGMLRLLTQSDYNTLNSYIDSVNNSKLQLTYGTYTGTGARQKYINVGHTLKAVFVVLGGYDFNETTALAVNGNDAYVDFDGSRIFYLSVSSTGFNVYYIHDNAYYTSKTNISNSRYIYIAFY